MTWWELTATGAEFVLLCFLLLFFTHSPESGCWGEVRGVVRLVEAQLHFADTRACAFMPRPIKMALSGCYLLGLTVQYRGIKAFYEAFSQPKVYALAARMPFFHNKGRLNFAGPLKLHHFASEV